MKLILASNSPRRKEILQKFGYDFTVLSSDFNETDVKPDPVAASLYFAKNKALSVFYGLSETMRGEAAVIGADTVVFYDGKILGKPKDADDAFKTLKLLSGNTHEVITAFSVVGEKFQVYGYDKSLVEFNALSDGLIAEYVATNKPLDKAGSYGVQDGYGLVRAVVGSTYNVIGFPIEKIKTVLDAVGCKKFF